MHWFTPLNTHCHTASIKTCVLPEQQSSGAEHRQSLHPPALNLAPGTAPRLRHKLLARPALSSPLSGHSRRNSCLQTCNKHRNFLQQPRARSALVMLSSRSCSCATACLAVPHKISLACRRALASVCCARSTAHDYPCCSPAFVRRCRRVYSVHPELRTRKHGTNVAACVPEARTWPAHHAEHRTVDTELKLAFLVSLAEPQHHLLAVSPEMPTTLSKTP